MSWNGRCKLPYWFWSLPFYLLYLSVFSFGIGGWYGYLIVSVPDFFFLLCSPSLSSGERSRLWASCLYFQVVLTLRLTLLLTLIVSLSVGLPLWLSWIRVRLEIRRLWVRHPPRSAAFFRGDWSWNNFYGHSLPSADSRRASVSFWQKYAHSTG